jgi:hypothetical protein
MANEIQCQLSFRASKGGATVAFQDSFKADMTGADMFQQTQFVGTTAELLDIGDLDASIGDMPPIIVKNLDPTNMVRISSVSGMTGFTITVYPRQFVLFVPSVEVLYVQADTAPCRILTVAATI